MRNLDLLLTLHPADLADQLERYEVDAAVDIIQQLPEPLAAACLKELDKDKFLAIIEKLPNSLLARLLGELPSNSAADLIGEISTERQGEILADMPSSQAEKTRNLLKYPEDTAGGIMNSRFISLKAEMTVDQVRELLRERELEKPTEDVSYLYVTDPNDHLVGIVSLRDLVFRKGERRIQDIMNRTVQSVLVDDDQEQIAQRFERYHYLGLPVLDHQNKLVGVVKASDALKVAQKEATEDMQLMVGLSGEERTGTPWSQSVQRRLPWLTVNLITAFLAAIVVGLFESTIAKWTALAIFLPIIAGQGGNAGMQTLTVIIRDMALGELAPGDGRKALIKEFVLGLINGLAIGILVGIVGWLWKSSPVLGLVAGLAMLLNQLAAALSGVLIPFGLKVLRVDPALASSIFVTTVTDVAGFFFFLGLASLALKWIPGL